MQTTEKKGKKKKSLSGDWVRKVKWVKLKIPLTEKSKSLILQVNQSVFPKILEFSLKANVQLQNAINWKVD